jgi:hypothetical protein
VAFLKFSRDKRGYENFYLVEPATRGKARPRVLYWFRTPPNVKVGRTPFDIEMQHAVEAQNPGVVFDWDAIVRTPIPPPSDTERWRERRRVERAMRSAADVPDVPDVDDEIEPIRGDSSDPVVPAAPAQAELVAGAAEPSPDQADAVDENPTAAARERAFGEARDAADGDAGEAEDTGEELATVEPIAASNTLTTSPQGGAPAGTGQRRRRRRRRGRKPQAQGGV